MSIEEKQNSPTYQDSNFIDYPQDEKEVSSFIKKFYKANIPVELVGSGSKIKLGQKLHLLKKLLLFYQVTLFPNLFNTSFLPRELIIS